MGCIPSKNNSTNKEKVQSKTTSHVSSISKSNIKTQNAHRKYGGITQLQGIDQSSILMRRKSNKQE